MAAKIKDQMPQGGGFVICSPEPIEFTDIKYDVPFTVEQHGKDITYKYSHKEGQLTLTKPAGHPITIKNIFSYKIKDTPNTYIFVRWAEDVNCRYGGCEHDYTLFKCDDNLTLYESNPYGCDI